MLFHSPTTLDEQTLYQTENWLQVTPSMASGGDMRRRTLCRQQQTYAWAFLSSCSNAKDMRGNKTGPSSPEAKIESSRSKKWRVAVCWFSALIHACSLDVHQILHWKSCITHCFQKNRSCSRHHNVPLSFCSYSCNHDLQSSLADLKNSNMRLIISVINYPDPGQNSHMQSKGYRISSDMTEGSTASLCGCPALPKERGQSFSEREKKKNLAWGQETLWVFFLCHIPLSENISPLPRAGLIVFCFQVSAVIPLWTSCHCPSPGLIFLTLVTFICHG